MRKAPKNSFMLKLLNYGSHQEYLNINSFLNREALAKTRSASCKLAVVTGKWDKVSLELSLVYTRDNNILLNLVSA